MIFTDVLKEFGEEYFRTEPDYWDIRLAGGETKRECIERVWGFINEVVKDSQLTKIGISTHGGVIRNIVHSLLPANEPKVGIPNCCVYHIIREGDDWKLIGRL